MPIIFISYHTLGAGTEMDLTSSPISPILTRVNSFNYKKKVRPSVMALKSKKQVTTLRDHWQQLTESLDKENCPKQTTVSSVNEILEQNKKNFEIPKSLEKQSISTIISRKSEVNLKNLMNEENCQKKNPETNKKEKRKSIGVTSLVDHLINSPTKATSPPPNKNYLKVEISTPKKYENSPLVKKQRKRLSIFQEDEKENDILAETPTGSDESEITPKKNRRKSILESITNSPIIGRKRHSALAIKSLIKNSPIKKQKLGKNKEKLIPENANIPEKIEKIVVDERKLKEAIKEILSTEQTYWKNLLLLQTVFYAGTQSILSSKQLKIIFSNSSEILNHSQDLLISFRDHISDSINSAPLSLLQPLIINICNSISSLLVSFLLSLPLPFLFLFPSLPFPFLNPSPSPPWGPPLLILFASPIVLPYFFLHSSRNCPLILPLLPPLPFPSRLLPILLPLLLSFCFTITYLNTYFWNDK